MSHLLGIDNGAVVILGALAVLFWLILKGGAQREQARRECVKPYDWEADDDLE